VPERVLRRRRRAQRRDVVPRIEGIIHRRALAVRVGVRMRSLVVVRVRVSRPTPGHVRIIAPIARRTRRRLARRIHAHAPPFRRIPIKARSSSRAHIPVRIRIPIVIPHRTIHTPTLGRRVPISAIPGVRHNLGTPKRRRLLRRRQYAQNIRMVWPGEARHGGVVHKRTVVRPLRRVHASGLRIRAQRTHELALLWRGEAEGVVPVFVSVAVYDRRRGRVGCERG
jgi:hypothetical protein